MGWELGGDGSPAHHHKALHWGTGGFSCALCTFAAAEGRPGSLWRGGAHPSCLITVTGEPGFPGTEETEGSISQAIPNPMGPRTMEAASHP